MSTIWFMIVAVMVAIYVLLDGFDLGAGAVHLFIARKDDERRRSCALSVRYGMATKSGCWPPAAHSTSPSRCSMRPASAASICR